MKLIDDLAACESFNDFALAYLDDARWTIAEKVGSGEMFDASCAYYFAGYCFGLYHILASQDSEAARADIFDLLACEAMETLCPSFSWTFCNNDALCSAGFIPDSDSCGFVGTRGSLTACIFICDGSLAASVYDANDGSFCEDFFGKTTASIARQIEHWLPC